MHFSFTGQNSEGKEISGTEEARDRFELARKLRANGVRVLTAEEAGAGKKSAFFSGNITIPFLSRVTLEEKLFFASNMSAMLEAGLSLSRALAVISKQNKNQTFAPVLRSLSAAVDRGETLSSAMATFPKIFPPVFIAMVGAGESSGDLPHSLKLVGDQLAKTSATRRKIRSAFMYPSIILGLAGVIGIVMLVYIVPTLADTFTSLKIELPLSTRIIIALSNFFKNYLLVAIGLIVGFCAFVRYLLMLPRGKRLVNWVSIKMPIIGKVVQNMNAAITARTLSSLVSSGVDIVSALETTRAVVQNSYYREALLEAQGVVQKGGTVASVFEKRQDLYPTLLGEMVEVGEETGKLSEMLLRVALFYEEQVDAVTKDLSTLVEPFLMILIGLIVMFFAVSMIQPIYSLTSAI